MRILPLIAAAAVSFNATMALAAGGVGEAMAVIDSASASGTVGKRTLAVGSSVFIGDLVATDSDGEAQLLFSDGTRMVVGSNSSLVIDEFLFRGKSSENRFAVRALGGAFRFISGKNNDQGYSIRTPSAYISVRGTAFDFTVTPSGATKLVLLQGVATLCGEGNNCAVVATPCGLLQTGSSNKVEEIETGDGRVRETRRHFPYLSAQSNLLEAFRLEGHGCTADAAGTETGIEGPESVASAPAPEPAPSKSNNGHGNGGEESQGEDPSADPDPSNPGKGGGVASTGGDTSGEPGGAEASSSADGGGNNGNGKGGGNGNGNGGGNGNGNGGGKA